MFNYTCLNPIAGVGLDLFSDDYKKVDDLAGADAALVRSAAMHDLDLPDSLLAVARAGAGYMHPAILSVVLTGVWQIRTMITLQKLQRNRRRTLQEQRFPERN